MRVTYFGTGIKLGGGFDVKARIPLDQRTVISDWTEESKNQLPATILYEGLHIYSEADKVEYVCTEIPANALTANDCIWTKIAFGQGSDLEWENINY